ncbi:MAG: molybdopterin molybdotransferase MoeA [Alphaproteobacteria bacterium]
MQKYKKNLISVNEAKKKLSQSLKDFKNTSESIHIKDSVNRVLSEDILSLNDIPRYDNSAIDGFAINYKSIKKNIKKFKVIGQSKPGNPFKKKLGIGEAIEVFTGSYILQKNNIDTVCYIENCNVKDRYVTILKSSEKGENVRRSGEDVKKNGVVFKKGRKIRTVDLAQLSSLGIKKIKVYRKIKVGIFSSGDEINTRESKSKFIIHDANKIVLLSLTKKVGCEAFDLGIIKDDLKQTKNIIDKNLSKFDLIITSGGISQSNIDNIGKYFFKSGKIDFWRLSIKPGRPIAFGQIKGKPFIGLPGNPVAAVVTFIMLVACYLKEFTGNIEQKNTVRLIPSNFSMKKKVGRTEWLRGSIKVINNKQYLEKFKTSGSGIISSISQSDGIIEIDEKVEYIRKGTILKFFRFEDI